VIVPLVKIALLVFALIRGDQGSVSIKDHETGAGGSLVECAYILSHANSS
jgi:hypothetical protein